MLIFSTVTPRDIYYQEQLLKAMKRKYKSQLKADVNSDEIIQVGTFFN